MKAPRSARRATAPTGVYHGLLRDEGSGLGRYLVHSLIAHGALAAILLVGWAGGDDPPPSLRPDAFYVAAIVLPKADALPDKATHVAKPNPGQSGAKPAPPPEPDRMVLKEKTEPKKGPEQPVEPVEKKEEPTPKRSRTDLLTSLGDASDQDRFATDVDGDEDATPSTLDARFGRKMSRYDRDIHDRSKERWRPDLALVQQVSDGVETIVTFTIEANGSITDIALAKGSGNYAFDMSCAAAIQRAGRMPPPPSAPWPVSILFRPEERK